MSEELPDAMEELQAQIALLERQKRILEAALRPGAVQHVERAEIDRLEESIDHYRYLIAALRSEITPRNQPQA